MAIPILFLLLAFTAGLSIYLFVTLKLELVKQQRRFALLATKLELSEVRREAQNCAVPKEMRGPVELYYQGRRARLQATFLPVVYK